MKLTILADNNTYIDQYYLGEPAASYCLEDGDKSILLDTGYSDVFMRNAKSLGVDLEGITDIVISHGHNDHTGGLRYLSKKIDTKHVNLIAHPDAFAERSENGLSIGSPVGLSSLEKEYHVTLSKEPFSINQKVVFLGEIPTYNDFERTKPIGVMKLNDHVKDDFVLDDSALVYKGKDGLFIVTGCSHSGVCNIIEHAKKVCEEQKVAGVLGGFHLFTVSDQLKKTIAYFKENNVKMLYPCHCVSFAAKAEIHKHIPVQEVGVGLSLNIV